MYVIIKNRGLKTPMAITTLPQTLFHLNVFNN